VNGKLRDLVSAPADASRDEIEQLARAAPKVQSYLNSGADVVKTIVVPGKLVNFVVR
jgi:leucyl-tRNA synthetase